MYHEHFGLRFLPFKITPDPAFLRHNSQNRRALRLLQSDLAQELPVSVVTGEAGTGKTTLILHILQTTSESLTVGLLSNLPSWEEDILTWVLFSFDLPDEPDDLKRFKAFEDFVQAEHSEGRKCVLIVDEAQNVSIRGLEQLRRLVNVNSGKDVRFRLILVGQPDLGRKLDSPDCAALAQRVGVSVTLGPMRASETEEYVRHRLTVAGGKPDIFDSRALSAVHRVSGGYPRVVNVVCDTAMVMAYGAGEHRIGGDTIELLGQRDSALSHLPDIGGSVPDRSESGSEKLPDDGHAPNEGEGSASPKGGDRASAEESVGGAESRDVFEFVSAKRQAAGPTIALPSGSLPGASWSPLQAAAGFQKVAITEGAILPLPFVPNPAPEPSAPEKVEQAPRISVPPDQYAPNPARRFTVRGALGVTVAASVVAAGVIFLNPTPLVEPELVAPDEVVSMQSVSALAPVTANRVPETPVAVPPLENRTGAQFLDRALAAGASDPSAAAVDYARAALRGEPLAAYYLGQLYETGDGVPRDLALARAWYASVEDKVRGARRRLGDLGPPQHSGELAAPILRLGGALTGGGAEFVWSSGEGVDPAFFVVELADEPGASGRRLPPQVLSALQLETLDGARFWRVLAVSPETQRYAVSDWRALGAGEINAQAARSDRTAGATPQAVIRLPAGTRPERVSALTEALAAASVPHRLETENPTNAVGSEVRGGAPMQIAYFYETDAETARTIADAVGAQSSVLVTASDDPKDQRPAPGLVLVRPEER